MATSSEESDGKEESGRPCCTTTCDKSCLHNASHSCTQALHGDPAPSASSAAVDAAAAPSPEEEAAAENDPPSPSLLLYRKTASSDAFASIHLPEGDDSQYGPAENICANQSTFLDEQCTRHDLSAMAAQSSSSSQPQLSPSPPLTASLVTDQDTNINRHSQQQEQQHEASDDRPVCNSRDLFSSVSNISLDPNAREFIPFAPTFLNSAAIQQQKTQSPAALHSYTPSFPAELCLLNHQVGALNLEVGAFSTMANYEPVHPTNQERNHSHQDMGAAAFYSMEPSTPDVDHYMGFHQKLDGSYENHGYGVYPAAVSHMGFPATPPGAVLASPAPLHNMGLSPLPPVMTSSPSPLMGAPIATPPFISLPPAGLMETQLSNALHSQRHHPPFYGSREHISRALIISGLPPHYNEVQVREELERWGTIRAIQTEVFPHGIQVIVQYFDLRAARQALRDMQNMYQQNQERHANSSYKHQVGAHNEGSAGNGRRGLLCGNVVSAQYIAAWTMQVPDAHNQGTLVLFNVGADVNMQDLRRVFEAYGNVREVREAPTKRQHKFVEFYDTRSAAAAWTALNGQEICGKCVKIEFSRQGRSTAHRQKDLDKAHQEMIAASANAGIQMQGSINMDPFSWNADIVSSHGLQGFINGGVHHQGWEGWPSNEGFASHFPMSVCLPTHPHTPQISHPGVVARYGSGRFLGDGNGRVCSPEAQHVLSSASRRGQHLQNLDPVVAATRSRFTGGIAGIKDKHMGGSRHTKGDIDFKFDEDEIYTCTSNPRTTLMIQNIPNKYSQKMLLSMLDQHCLQFNSNLGADVPEAAYDFMYLPIDFKNKCNLGYAFVNFTTPQATLSFYKAFHGKAWEEFNSRKICGVAFARLQGRSALEEHFRTSRFACDTEEYLPVLFVPPRNGANLSQPRVAVGQMGISRGCRTGNGGNAHSHMITYQPSDSTSEHNKVLNNSDSSSACEAEENTARGDAQDTPNAQDVLPPEMEA